ncbi:MAG TPA: MogA/MoaB family molybdenum cofactor biosynthesis protein [Acidimicrobiia bacterium]
MKAAVVTVSDGVAAGSRVDESGDILAAALEAAGYEVAARKVVPDEQGLISAVLEELALEARLVMTTGGTGFGPRDVTPEATSAVIDRVAPGLVHLLFARGLESTPMAVLSRAVVGNRGDTLIVNLPGSPRGVEEGFASLVPVLPHALELLAGNTSH